MHRTRRITPSLAVATVAALSLGTAPGTPVEGSRAEVHASSTLLGEGNWPRAISPVPSYDLTARASAATEA